MVISPAVALWVELSKVYGYFSRSGQWLYELSKAKFLEVKAQDEVMRQGVAFEFLYWKQENSK